MNCSDKILDDDGKCSHLRRDNKVWVCTLSKYFECIESQDQNQTQPQNQDLKSKANPSPNTNNVDSSAGVSSPKGSPASIILPRLSYSAIQDFAHCHRKYYWSNIIRIEPRETSLALLKGSCGHEMIQYIHTAEQPELAGINNIVDKYQDLLSPSSQTLNPSLEVLKPLGWAYLELNEDKLFKGRVEVHWDIEGLHGYLDLVQYEDGGDK